MMAHLDLIKFQDDQIKALQNQLNKAWVDGFKTLIEGNKSFFSDIEFNCVDFGSTYEHMSFEIGVENLGMNITIGFHGNTIEDEETNYHHFEVSETVVDSLEFYDGEGVELALPASCKQDINDYLLKIISWE